MKHPYETFEGTEMWKIVDKAITALVENQDIKTTTAQPYVTGYIIKNLSEAGFIPDRVKPRV